MITRFLIIFTILCVQAQGKCTIDNNDAAGGKVHEKIKSWPIYEKNFTVVNGSTTYHIGLCKELKNDNSTNIGILQLESAKIYSLGLVDHVRLVEGDGWLMVTYEHGEPFDNICENRTRSASVVFVCAKKKNSNSIQILQQHTSNGTPCSYLFQMEVDQMCVQTKPDKTGLSGGAIFLIILLSVASAYLIGGFLFMRIKRGARGIDQIPNLEMWRKLGHLAADGCDFCCRCNSATPRPGYFLDESGPDLRGDDDILSP